jgi:hypothetical protein
LRPPGGQCEKRQQLPEVIEAQGGDHRLRLTPKDREPDEDVDEAGA